MQRRLLLATLGLVVLLALAGCVDSAGSLRMTEVNDSELADGTTRPASGGDIFPAIRQQLLVRTAIENGSVTVADVRESVRTDLPYRYQDRYYDVELAAESSEPGVELTVAVDVNATDPAGTRVEFGSFDPRDRQRLRPFLEHEPRELVSGPDARFPLAIRDGERADSRILEHAGSSVVVEYDGEEYVLEIGSPEETAVQVHRYEATLRADSTGAYVRSLRDNYTVDLSGVEGDERSILESAAGDSYHAESTDDRAFGRLVDRLRTEPAIERDGGSGTWLVRFDGTTYLTDARYGQFVEGTVTAEAPEVTPN